MHQRPSVRLTAELNAGLDRSAGGTLDAERVIGGDVAHHVVDPEALLDLDPLAANPLAAALDRLRAIETERWILVLPSPGALGSLRGPAPLNLAALEAGEAVVGASCERALVPYRVGRAVQWRVFRANRPFLPDSPYDADRVLSEAVLRAAASLQHLEVAGGRRPQAGEVGLPPGYSPRQLASAERAAMLLAACEDALSSDGGSRSSYEVSRRAEQLRTVRDAAVAALCAAVTWLR
jgi:hypothetical protein